MKVPGTYYKVLCDAYEQMKKVSRRNDRVSS